MRILVVCPDEFDRESFLRIPEYEFHFCEPAPSHWRPTPEFDPVAYYERALNEAGRHAVDAVVSTHDLGDLIAALIARDLDLPGPSPKAVFLCLHKYYGRQREARPIACTPIPLNGPAPCIEYPVYVKPPWLKLGMLGFKAADDAGFERAMAVARREYPAWARQYVPLFQQAIDLNQYPLAGEDIMLIEEFVGGRQVTVEGWVRKGDVTIVAITDTNLFPGTRVIDSFSIPSRLAPWAQSAAADFATEAVRRIAFNDGFFNAELWIPENGDIRLTEINGRSAVCFAGIYQPALGIDIFRAVAGLACGVTPESPRPNGRVAGQFNLTSFGENTAGELADYSAASEIPGLNMFWLQDERVHPVSEGGVVLGQFEAVGSSYEEICARAEAVRRRVLKR